MHKTFYKGGADHLFSLDADESLTCKKGHLGWILEGKN